jgi:hypothetical protein
MTAAPPRFSHWLPRSPARAPAHRVKGARVNLVRISAVLRGRVFFDLALSFRVASLQLPLATFLERYRPEE